MGRVIDAIIRLTDNFSSPMSNTIKKMSEASREGDRMRKSIDKAGQTISKAGASLTAGITLPVAGVAVACGKMALDFENGIAKVSTIADTSIMSLDKIKAGTMDLSNQLGIAVNEISEAQYSAISAGASTENSLGLVKSAAMAAKAGFTDTATAIDGLTTVYNSYQGAVDYSAISDQMMMTQNYGKTTFGELASSMGQVTPVANALNVSTGELFSSVAVLTKNGIATSSAVTGLKAAYSNILKPTSDAQKEAKKLGLEFNAAHLKSVGWAQFISEVKEKTGGNTESMAKLFGSVEALNSMTVLAGSGLEDFNSCLDQMTSSAGLTQQAYEKMLTPSERWSISLNKIKNAGIKVGEKLLPVFEKVTGVVDKVADKFNNLSDSQIEMAMKIAGIAAAAGPLVSVFGKLVSGSSKVMGIFAKVSKAGGLLKMGLALIASPAGIVIASLAGIIAVAVLVYKNFDKIKAAAGQFANRFQSQFSSVRSAIEAFKLAFSDVAVKFQSTVGKIGPMVQAIQERLMPVVNFIKSVFVKEFQVAFTAVTSFLQGFSTGAADIINGIVRIFDGLITFVTGVFSGNWEQAWNGIADIFGGALGAIGGVAKGIINGVASAINGVVEAINGMGITIPDWVPFIGGKAFSLNIPKIPMLYKGTQNWQGGIAQINERGGEIVDLPRGTRVYPHDESVRMARSEGRRNIILTKLADQIIVREEADIDRIAETLVRKLQKAEVNMGGT
ncbi:phage tail tape measure protein [Hungatella hathewayi]|uniref:phage tail tape measure protein n=1 Tax=Hungatella hathewayi TaxID=154046 RepID=UPI003567F880